MDPRHLAHARSLADQVKALDDSTDSGGVSTKFMEVRLGNDEVVVRGNREALIYLAWTCLSLASRGVPGSHFHFDEVGIVDHADVPLVVVLAERPGPAEARS